MTKEKEIHDKVKAYYSDLTTNKGGELASDVCCCAGSSMRESVKAISSELPDMILTHFYGCGSPLPEAAEGCTIVDLGCGTGRDVYVASKMVGPKGNVIGVDMNDDQLDFAKTYQKEIAERWGFSNTTFIKSYIEDLSAIPDESVDVVISNCVINLSPDKEQVFREVWRILKTGGELYFSDIYADRRIPEEISTHPQLLGECIGGALYIEDFRRLLEKIGWKDIRLVSSAESPVNNPELEALTKDIKYRSNTFRAFKLPEFLEDGSEDYGQTVIYNGGITDFPDEYELDSEHSFKKGEITPVSGNTAAILEHSRLRAFFSVRGNRNHHYGAFDDYAWVNGFCCDCGCGDAGCCSSEEESCGCGAAEESCGCSSDEDACGCGSDKGSSCCC